MKFECEKSKIEPVIQKVSKLSGKHLTLPVLSCIYLEVLNPNKLILKATNLDVGIEIEIKIKTLEVGVMTVPANILIGTISSVTLRRPAHLCSRSTTHTARVARVSAP
jgi:DNA polymerase III sliding clamp (beta) subunit (PCNA family)